jgi:hypothetical protein
MHYKARSAGLADKRISLLPDSSRSSTSGKLKIDNGTNRRTQLAQGTWPCSVCELDLIIGPIRGDSRRAKGEALVTFCRPNDE